MPASAAMNPTLIDLAKTLDPNGQAADVVELLNLTNEIIDDMVWQEGNLTTGNRTTVRSGLPAATWRRMYQGVMPSKSRTVQVTDNCGMLEAYSVIDKALADLNGRKATFMLRESAAFLEAMSQEMAETLFYGNETSAPAEFTGLSPRFNNRSTAIAETAANIIHGGGSGSDNGSIWLCVWSPNSGYGIVPKGSKAGFEMDDRGQQTQTETDGSKWEAYVTHFKWQAGLTIRDWRQFVRIANIDKSDLTPTAATGPKLYELMFQAMEQVHSLKAGKAAFYMSRKMRTFLRQQCAEKTSNATLSVENVGGVQLYDFQGIPIRIVDRLSTDEALVPNG